MRGWATGDPRRDSPHRYRRCCFYSSHFAASRRVRTRRRRNRLDTASLPPVPPTKMCVACTHDSHLQSILIPPSPDPTTAATGHRGTCASSRRSCRCPLASAAPLYRVPRAASTSIGCQPTPCLRRLLPERDLGPCCHAADPCPCASSSRPGRVATRPCPRSYRRSCDVILIAAAASLARRPWGLEGATCSGGNSLDSRRRPCSRLTLPFGLWQWLSLPCPPPSPGCGIRVCVWGGVFVCIYMCVFGVLVCVNTTSGTH